MKRTILAVAVVLAFSTAAWAQMGGPGMMGGESGQQAHQGGWWPGMMMGPGMMGGYGGYGMMGYGMGPGMMGGWPGCGMGPGMMGMGPGMMGGYGMMNVYNPQMQKFLDGTRDLREDLTLKQFEYMEALRNPKTTPETVLNLQKEIRDLNVRIYEKMPLYQR